MEENNLQGQKNTSTPKIDSQKVEMYILSNRQYFPSEKLMYLKSKMSQIDDKKFEMISAIDLKSPQTVFLVSMFLGVFGIDRFIIGDVGMGILKLFSLGMCSILWMYDLFTIAERVKKINFQNIMVLL